MMRKSLLIISVIALFSCQSPEKDSGESNRVSPRKENAIEQDDQTLKDTSFVRLDTTLSHGAKVFLVHHLGEESFLLHVSTEGWDTTWDINNELEKDGSSINPLSEHRVLWSTEHFAGLRASCGAPCYYEVVIPLFPNDRPRRYFFPYTNQDKGVHLSPDLIAFNGDHNTPDGLPTIKLKNLLTGKTDSLAVTNDWQTRVSMNEFVDTLYATYSYFFIGQKDESGRLISQCSKKVDLD